MADRDREFLAMYLEERIGDQTSYFLKKAASYKKNARLLIIAAGIIMFLSSLSAWAASQDWLGMSAWWKGLATVLPALSGAIVAMRGLFEFKRNQSRYRQNRLDLAELEAELAPGAITAGAELREQTRTLVEQVESLLAEEKKQWHKLMGVEKSAPGQ